jgi:hypothetical protein
MENELIVRFADTEDVNSIGFLAHQIWPATYGAILDVQPGSAQETDAAAACIYYC